MKCIFQEAICSNVTFCFLSEIDFAALQCFDLVDMGSTGFFNKKSLPNHPLSSKC